MASIAEVFRLLKNDCKADWRTRDYLGRTVFIHAAIGGNVEIMKEIWMVDGAQDMLSVCRAKVSQFGVL